MNFVIVGADALGSIYAAYRARAGRPVSLVARGERAAALAKHGIGIAGEESFHALYYRDSTGNVARERLARTFSK